MILTAKPARQSARPARLVLLAIALLVLPLSLSGLWAEPPQATDEATTEAAGDAPQPAAVATDDQTAPPEIPPQNELEHELANVIRQATINLELTKTNHNRKLAAERQVEAVKNAFEAGTVTLDQLLEAQRRLVEAEMALARTKCDLCTVGDRREYLLRATALYISNSAVNEARQTWRKVHASAGSGESPEEAQAREQFYQFKSQSQTLLKELQESEARRRR
jgi:hypothetical protein